MGTGIHVFMYRKVLHIQIFIWRKDVEYRHWDRSRTAFVSLLIRTKLGKPLREMARTRDK